VKQKKILVSLGKRGRQDLQDVHDFLCLNYQFPEEIDNGKSLRE